MAQGIVKLSEDAQEFLEDLTKIDGIDLTPASLADQLGGNSEIGYEVCELIRQADQLEFYDDGLTEDQKSLITSLIWTVAQRTGLTIAPAGVALNKEKIKLKKSTQATPVAELLSEEFLTLVFKNMYIAACLVMKRENSLKG